VLPATAVESNIGVFTDVVYFFGNSEDGKSPRKVGDLGV
jgi:hypothetical protein